MRGMRIAAGVWLGTLLLSACGDGGDSATPGDMQAGDAAPRGTVTLTGAGATFPYPVYSKWFDEYGKTNPVRVNYQPIGSGGGIRQITEGTVDFGASDAPMNADERAAAPGVLQLPSVLGAVAVTYNLPEVSQPIRLSGDVLADIFRGEVKKWNAPRIQQLNPGVQLPGRDILVVYRTDGSGTTYVFTEYLGEVSPAWKQQVGVAKSVQWPTGLGAKGNEGVAGQVRQTEGAIGYVELAYARQNDLSIAAVRNQAGSFVVPSVAATTAAAAGVADRLGDGSDLTLSVVNAPGAEAYPISTWTYLLIPSQMADCDKAGALSRLVRWGLEQGDDFARGLDYAPLPDAVQQRVLQRLGTVTCGPNRQPVGSS